MQPKKTKQEIKGQKIKDKREDKEAHVEKALGRVLNKPPITVKQIADKVIL